MHTGAGFDARQGQREFAAASVWKRKNRNNRFAAARLELAATIGVRWQPRDGTVMMRASKGKHAMSRRIDDCRLFFREFRRNFHTTGALLPSGQRLARALCSFR